ncbi:MAG: calcium/sodium antiporter [Acidobacteriota bacterium]
MLLNLALIMLGVALLYVGGEMLVRYSTELAKAMRVSPVVIGLTVVAFGTSAPELAVGVTAALNDQGALAFGNVVGSNIANIGLILGLTTLFTPLAIDSQLQRREIPFMIGISILLFLFVATGEIGRLPALIYAFLFVSFLAVLLRSGQMIDEEEDGDEEKGGLLKPLLGAVAGLALLIGGATLMVEAATELARALGVSERVIGLTLTAFGTSVPELAGCLVAAAKRQSGLVLGNIIGSNIFNLLLILPSVASIQPIAVSLGASGIDVGVMIVFAFALMVGFVGDRRVNRWEGALLLAGYLGYNAYLALSEMA